MAKFKEKICVNCKHWQKSHKDEEYGLWVGNCVHQPVGYLPYENSDCGEFKPKGKE